MTNEEKILILEKEVKMLKDSLATLLVASTPTKLYLRKQILFDKGGQVGFFGKDPISQQSLASDTLANLLTALRAYGIIKT